MKRKEHRESQDILRLMLDLHSKLKHNITFNDYEKIVIERNVSSFREVAYSCNISLKSARVLVSMLHKKLRRHYEKSLNLVFDLKNLCVRNHIGRIVCVSWKEPSKDKDMFVTEVLNNGLRKQMGNPGPG